MKQYPNFYENLKEANDRLARTIVLYAGLPVHIIAITDHMKDGIFRAWCAPITEEAQKDPNVQAFYQCSNNYGLEFPELGRELDKVLEKVRVTPVVRKHLSSPQFNRFRPFPLGMCNVGTHCFYVERQPIRPMMHQGLVKYALHETLITAGSRKENPARVIQKVEMFSSAFHDCIVADHQTAEAVLKALKDPDVDNNAHAFHREFAFVRGPLGMIFLAYRTDVIGILPTSDFSHVKLGRRFSHCREAVEELYLFGKIS
jgi:hypothetical protein